MTYLLPCHHMEGPLTENAARLLDTFERLTRGESLQRKMNLMTCVSRSGLRYDEGRAAANELVQAGRVRIEGDLG